MGGGRWGWENGVAGGEGEGRRGIEEGIKGKRICE